MTTADELQKFFVNACDADLEDGGEVTCSWDGHGEAKLHDLEIRPK